MENENEVMDEEKVLETDSFEEFLKNLFSESEKNNKNIFNFNNIINNHGVYTGDGATFDNIQMESRDSNPQKQKAVFEDVHSLNKWMKEKYASYDMVNVLSIIVFEGIAYEHINTVAEVLYQLLNLENEKGEVDSGLTYIMECLGAYRCTIIVNTLKTEVVKLSGKGSRERLLENIWKEYPKLHEKIVEWLIQVYIRSEEVVRQKCMDTFIWIAKTDEYFFYNYMIDLVGTKKDINIDLLFSRVFLGLYKYEAYMERIHKLLVQWSDRNDAHYLLCSLYADAKLGDIQGIKENAIWHYIDNLFRGYNLDSKQEFYANLYYFYSAGFRRFTFYKIVIEQLYDRLILANTKEKKEILANMFYLLLSIDIRQFDGKKEDAILIKLCFSSSEIKYKLYELWRLVWECKRLQNRLYTLMSMYVYKVTSNGKESRLEEFIYRILNEKYTGEWQKEICFKIRRRIENGKNNHKR